MILPRPHPRPREIRRRTTTTEALAPRHVRALAQITPIHGVGLLRQGFSPTATVCARSVHFSASSVVARKSRTVARRVPTAVFTSGRRCHRSSSAHCLRLTRNPQSSPLTPRSPSRAGAKPPGAGKYVTVSIAVRHKAAPLEADKAGRDVRTLLAGMALAILATAAHAHGMTFNVEYTGSGVKCRATWGLWQRLILGSSANLVLYAALCGLSAPLGFSSRER